MKGPTKCPTCNAKVKTTQFLDSLFFVLPNHKYYITGAMLPCISGGDLTYEGITLPIFSMPSITYMEAK